jgi:hypothetical protein
MWQKSQKGEVLFNLGLPLLIYLGGGKVMASLVDLLRYKKELEINDPNTGKPIKKIWIRVLGDLDLQNSYKAARLASAAKREALRDPETEDYKDEVLGVIDLSYEEQIDIIKTAKLSNIISEAAVAVIRPELPELPEVAVEPDAASLEDLEKLDSEEIKVEKDYSSKIDEYIRLRTEELDVKLRELSPEELVKEAKSQVSVLVPFSIFMTELNAQKAFYGTFQDSACKIREFDTLNDFKQLPKEIQETLVIAINQLEVSGADIKN